MTWVLVINEKIPAVQLIIFLQNTAYKAIPIVQIIHPTVFKIGRSCLQINCTKIRDMHIIWI